MPPTAPQVAEGAVSLTRNPVSVRPGSKTKLSVWHQDPDQLPGALERASGRAVLRSNCGDDVTLRMGPAALGAGFHLHAEVLAAAAAAAEITSES